MSGSRRCTIHRCADFARTVFTKSSAASDVTVGGRRRASVFGGLLASVCRWTSVDSGQIRTPGDLTRDHVPAALTDSPGGMHVRPGGGQAALAPGPSALRAD